MSVLKTFCDRLFTLSYLDSAPYPILQSFTVDGVVNTPPLPIPIVPGSTITTSNIAIWLTSLNLGPFTISETGTDFAVLFPQNSHVLTALVFDTGTADTVVDKCQERETDPEKLGCNYSVSVPQTGEIQYIYEIVVDSIIYGVFPIQMTDTIAVQAWLSSLGLGAITYQFTGGNFTITSINNTRNFGYIGVTADIEGNTFPLFTESSCVFIIHGCTDPFAVNYNPAANTDDGSCVLPIKGCTDNTAINFNPQAQVNDGTCRYDLTNASILERLICCTGKKGYDNAVALRSGVKLKCCAKKTLKYLIRAVKTLRGYITPGTVIQSWLDAETDIDLSSLIGQLGNDMEFEVTITVNGVPIVIGTITDGDYQGSPLTDVIDDIIAALTTGYQGFNIDPSIKIKPPANLGSVPNGSVITISLQPYYYLRAAIGITSSQKTYTGGFAGTPAFVDNINSPGYGLIYVPMNDNPKTEHPTFNSDNVQVGDMLSVIIDTGLSNTVYAGGVPFTMALTSGGSTYNIIADVIAYNDVTGDLDFLITAIFKFPGAIPFSPFTDILGSQVWSLKVNQPGFGTINVYSFDGNTNLFTFEGFIETTISQPKECHYDEEEDCIFVCNAGADYLNNSGIERINMSSPFTIANEVVYGTNYGADLSINTFRDTLYLNSGNVGMAKFSKLLAHNAASDIGAGQTPFNDNNKAKTFDPITGVMYYAKNTPSPQILKLDPTSSNLAVMDTQSLFLTMTDVIDGLTTRGVIDMFYHQPTNTLFVCRYTSTGGQFLLQSYILTGNMAAMNASRIDYVVPSVPGDTSGRCNGNIRYQPDADKIVVVSVSGKFVHVFDPVTGTFDVSSANVAFNDAANTVVLFSKTDDIVNKNFYGTSNNYLDAISRRAENLVFTGTFAGGITEVVQTEADNCITEAEKILLEQTALEMCVGCCEEEVNSDEVEYD